MKSWIGKWLIIVAIFQMAVSFVVLGEPLRELLAGGALSSDPANFQLMAGLFAIGLALLIAAVITDNQLQTDRGLPKFAALTILALVVAGLFLAPVSGLWFALPPAITLAFLYRQPNSSIIHRNKLN